MILPSGMQPEQMGVFNPLAVMILIPVFETYGYPALAQALGREPVPPLLKMGLGMLCAIIAFIVSGLVQCVTCVPAALTFRSFKRLNA